MTWYRGARPQLPSSLLRAAVENLRDDDVLGNATSAYHLLRRLGNEAGSLLREYAQDADAQLRGYVARLLASLDLQK